VADYQQQHHDDTHDSKLMAEDNPIINEIDVRAGLASFDKQQKTTLTSRGSSMSASSRIGEKRNSHQV